MLFANSTIFILCSLNVHCPDGVLRNIIHSFLGALRVRVSVHKKDIPEIKKLGWTDDL